MALASPSASIRGFVNILLGKMLYLGLETHLYRRHVPVVRECSLIRSA